MYLESLHPTFYRSITSVPVPEVIRNYFIRQAGRQLGNTTSTRDEEMVSLRPLALETCSIYCDSQADAVFLHCGHGGVCHKCAAFLFHRNGECCICRQLVQGV